MYPKTIYDLFEKLILMHPEQAEVFAQNRMTLINTLLLIQFSFIGIVFVLSIFLTHKIAGPIYKLTNYLEEVRHGGANYPLTFRDGDYFSEVAEEINLTIDYFRNKDETEIEYLEEVAAYIENIALVVPQDKKPVLDEIQLKLKEITESNDRV
ncbi:MAG: hypothetical protein CME62_16920 [Halobacteriovoraceae bacterium]|nr:hypothetical protein [Halobacteriovoraceae bacterium]|tara:strand:+ start:23618 stop:24076 length:459 start_codon:yes stop_codon:yes gene_type:complete